MFEFRFYVLDDIGHVLKTRQYQCADQHEALAHAMQLKCEGFALEIWRGLNRIVRLEAADWADLARESEAA
jgi:hypothetical protein